MEQIPNLASVSDDSYQQAVDQMMSFFAQVYLEFSSYIKLSLRITFFQYVRHFDNFERLLTLL